MDGAVAKNAVEKDVVYGGTLMKTSLGRYLAVCSLIFTLALFGYFYGFDTTNNAKTPTYATQKLQPQQDSLPEFDMSRSSDKENQAVSNHVAAQNPETTKTTTQADPALPITTDAQQAISQAEAIIQQYQIKTEPAENSATLPTIPESPEKPENQVALRKQMEALKAELARIKAKRN